MKKPTVSLPSLAWSSWVPSLIPTWTFPASHTLLAMLLAFMMACTSKNNKPYLSCCLNIVGICAVEGGEVGAHHVDRQGLDPAVEWTRNLQAATAGRVSSS